MKTTTQIFLFLGLTLSSIFSSAAPSLNTVKVSIQDIQYSDSTMMVEIAGLMPHKCAAMPHPELSTTDTPNSLVLGVKAYATNDVCALQVGGQYHLAFDIRSLKFELERLNLNPEGEYKIVSSNKQFAIVIDFRQIPFTLPYASESLLGEVRFVPSQNKFVLVTEDQVFNMNSPIIDLQKFAGQRFELQGHVLKQRIVRAPLINGRNEPVSLLVTGINTTSY